MAKKRRGRNYFKRFWDSFWRPEMLVLPGQLAFFLFLSLVPTFTLISYVCSYLQLSNDVMTTLLQRALSQDISDLVTPILTSTKITPAFFITLGSGYFIASNGMASIIVSANSIYGIEDSGFFRRRLKSILMELFVVILFLFILIVPVFGNEIIRLLEYVNFESTIAYGIIKTLTNISGPLSWIVIFLAIQILYKIAPDKKIPWRSTIGGAIFTTIAWIGITYCYSIYINSYANYSVFYGALANIVILLVWIWLLSYAFVIGMAMNFHEELEKTGVIDVVTEIQNEMESTTENINLEEIIEDTEKEEDKKEKENKEE
jgi:membrane protein